MCSTCCSASHAEARTAGACGSPEYGGATPLFLARFHAAWIHTELATMYTSHLERQREYEAACALLRALLGGSTCPSRRCVNINLASFAPVLPRTDPPAFGSVRAMPLTLQH
jgi:hypothetical protein